MHDHHAPGRGRKEENMADTNPIIFRTYQTYGGYYVYDRHTNSVITLKPDEFQELQAVEK